MILKKLLYLALAFSLQSANVIAQDSTNKNVFEPVKTLDEIGQRNVYQPDKSDANSDSDFSPLSSYEFYLSMIVIGFGLLALLIEFILIIKKRISQENTIKFVVITLIITSILFLITAGYSNDQIAPAMGLLGTIAGYLLGKSKSDNREGDDNK